MSVPVEPFQRRLAAMDPPPSPRYGPLLPDAASLVALRMGWFSKGDPDGGRVRRTLGLRPDTAYLKGGRYYPAKRREWVRPATALRLCEAMGMDFAEIDL